MTEPKTLAYLNAKWWYRLIKVLFILLFLIVSGIAIGLNFDSVGNHQTDYTVACNYGNKSTFLAAKDKQIYISTYYDYSEKSLTKLPADTIEKLLGACEVSSDDIAAQSQSYANGAGVQFFNLTETRVNVVTYWDAILWSLVSTAIIALVFEIFRRVFYYIVLGSLRPKKS